MTLWNLSWPLVCRPEKADVPVKGSTILLEHVQAWAMVGTGVVAAIGLAGVYLSVREGRKQQRIQSGPFIRVDIGPTSDTISNFETPAAHFINREFVQDIALDTAADQADDQKVSVSAWATNYQTHPLGLAYGVSLRFIYEIMKFQNLQHIFRFPMCLSPILSTTNLYK